MSAPSDPSDHVMQSDERALNVHELAKFKRDAEQNKNRAWYARKYVVLESSFPAEENQQKLVYRKLSVWENIKALVGYGPNTNLINIAGFCSKNGIDDTALKPKYESFINKRIDELGNQRIDAVKSLFSKFQDNQLTEDLKSLKSAIIFCQTELAAQVHVARFDSLKADSSRLAFLKALVEPEKQTKCIQKITRSRDRGILVSVLRHALRFDEKSIASLLFQALSQEEKQVFLNQQSLETLKQLMGVISNAERSKLFFEATHRNDFATAVLYLTDTPTKDELHCILSLESDKQQDAIIQHATPSQLLHLLYEAGSNSDLQSKLIERLGNYSVDKLQVALSQFTAPQFLELLHRLSTPELGNKFLSGTVRALLPDVRVALFCKLPTSPLLNTFQLLRGIHFNDLSEAEKKALRPLLYAEFQAGYQTRDLNRVLQALEVLPWTRETHFDTLLKVMDPKVRNAAFTIIDMISKSETRLPQEEIGPLLGLLRDLIISTEPGHAELAERLSFALKSQNIKADISSLVEVALKKGLERVASNLLDQRK